MSDTEGAAFEPWQNDALSLADSYSRPTELVYAKQREPRNRLLLFLTWWPSCDAPWHCRSYLAEMLRRALKQVSLSACLRPDELSWFKSLPAEIEIFRGCEHGRGRGLSWTTDIKVALGFARGKRCINHVPTLMTAKIPKQHVFGVFLGRNESEVAVDPRRLRCLKEERAQEARDGWRV
jgi:hypothetical protein